MCTVYILSLLNGKTLCQQLIYVDYVEPCIGAKFTQLNLLSKIKLHVHSSLTSIWYNQAVYAQFTFFHCIEQGCMCTVHLLALHRTMNWVHSSLAFIAQNKDVCVQFTYFHCMEQEIMCPVRLLSLHRTRIIITIFIWQFVKLNYLGNYKLQVHFGW